MKRGGYEKILTFALIKPLSIVYSLFPLKQQIPKERQEKASQNNFAYSFISEHFKHFVDF